MYTEQIKKQVFSSIIDDVQEINLESPYWKGRNWKDTIKYKEDLRINDENNQDQLRRVLKWGGINNFKGYQNFPTSLAALKKHDSLPSCATTSISSFSKLFSFFDSQNYFILDARVALRLNTLLINISDNTLLLPFNFNRSRNQSLRNYAAYVFNGQNFNYYDPSEGYYAFNDLIISLYNYSVQDSTLNSLKLVGPQIFEMYLFKSVDEIIQNAG